MYNQTFKFACPHCGQHLEAEPDWVGMEVECPTCGKVITVPHPPTVATLGTERFAPNISAKPQPEIQTRFTSEEGDLPPTPVISVVEKGKGVSGRKRAWLVPVAIGATVLLIVGLLVASDKKSLRRDGEIGDFGNCREVWQIDRDGHLETIQDSCELHEILFEVMEGNAASIDIFLATRLLRIINHRNNRATGHRTIVSGWCQTP